MVGLSGNTTKAGQWEATVLDVPGSLRLYYILPGGNIIQLQAGHSFPTLSSHRPILRLFVLFSTLIVGSWPSSKAVQRICFNSRLVNIPVWKKICSNLERIRTRRIQELFKVIIKDLVVKDFFTFFFWGDDFRTLVRPCENITFFNFVNFISMR